MTPDDPDPARWEPVACQYLRNMTLPKEVIYATRLQQRLTGQRKQQQTPPHQSGLLFCLYILPCDLL